MNKSNVAKTKAMG